MSNQYTRLGPGLFRVSTTQDAVTDSAYNLYTQSSGINSTFYLTFVGTNTTTPSRNRFYTNFGLAYNPYYQEVSYATTSLNFKSGITSQNIVGFGTSDVTVANNLIIGKNLTVLGNFELPPNIAVNNLVGGGPGDIPYQFSSGITSFISPGPANYVFTSRGSGLSPEWRESVQAGVSSYSSVSGYSTISGFSTFSSIAGYSTSSGISSYSIISGISSFSIISGYSTSSGIASYSTNSGISSFSIISGYSTSSGISSYSNISGYSTSSGIASYSTNSGISSFSIISGYSTSSGIASYSTNSGISSFSIISGYSTLSGISSYSTNSGISSFSIISGYSTLSGISSYSTNSGISTYSNISGYSTSSGISSYSNISGYSTSSGIASSLQYQTGTIDASSILNRNNHTGLQTASTISDFSSTARGLFSATTPLGYNPTTGVLSWAATGVTFEATGNRLNLASFIPQASTPPTPVSGFTLFPDVSGRFSWIGANGFTRTIDATGITTSRVWTPPDRSGVISLTQSEIVSVSYASTVNIDFESYSDKIVSINLTGNIIFTFSNMAPGRGCGIDLTCDSTARNITFPADVKFLGTVGVPTSIQPSKVMVIGLISTGTTTASVRAGAAVQS
jgi:hypothetical protein